MVVGAHSTGHHALFHVALDSRMAIVIVPALHHQTVVSIALETHMQQETAVLEVALPLPLHHHQHQPHVSLSLPILPFLIKI